MPWVRFDDQFATNRKVTGLSDPAFRYYVSAIFWSARNLTDGFVPEEDLDDVAPRNVKRPDSFVPELVKRSLWHGPDEHCDSPDCPEIRPDGWTIHDYHAYQPTKGQVIADRAAAAERQRQSRARRKQSSQGESQRDSARDSRKSHTTPTRPDPEASNEASVGDGKPPQPRKRGTRVPEPFEINESMRAWAKEHAPLVELEFHTAEFVDFWRGVSGQKGVKLDWEATWRNRMRRKQEDLNHSPGNAVARRGQNESVTDQRVKGWMAMGDQLEGLS